MSNNNLTLHHVSLLVQDTEKSVDFYQQILKLERITRPDWEYPGAWFQIGNQQMHLIELSNPDPISGRPKHGGHDRHVAFTVGNIDLIVKELDENNVGYSLSRSGRRALFFRDLDANAIEIFEQP